ncbi:LAMI_0F09626g1_1 [Lachancea mirantina]|uniref:LAMI_0F09626g1_1 n=1 Tax=Lachancea mirantina TaxID=1230905 RepID=A0A1G4K1B2_9SACH|nr:LAMI_0F09626g1_1 [Lachancea mirantina]
MPVLERLSAARPFMRLFARSSGGRGARNAAALFGGTLFLGYYSLWGKNPLLSESIKSIKHFGTSTPESQEQNTISLLSDAEVTRRLRQLEESHFVQRGSGLVRFDVAQLPSNSPIEDAHIEQVVTVPGRDEARDEDLYFFGVFDGHSGPYTSAKLAQDLVPYVAHQLSKVYTAGVVSASVAENVVDNALSDAFKLLDRDIVLGSLGNLFQNPSKETLTRALPAVSGSCALLAMFDSQSSTLKCAVTGDSRALLASVNKEGQWSVKALTVDQTGDNESEVARIQAEHPGEQNAVRNGRVLGSLQPSRAFGDYRYKVKDIDGKSVRDLPDHLKIYFRREPNAFHTPPYVTAEPVISTAQVNSDVKFMVLASDGLYELLSNDEIASLVVKWMQHNPVVPGAAPLRTSGPAGKLTPVRDTSEDAESQRPAFRYRSQTKNPSEYLLEDKNVATHLIRNALSAKGNKDYVSTLVSIPSPMSRKYRDDLTVTVVFFDHNENHEQTGRLVINDEATTKPRAKL